MVSTEHPLFTLVYRGALWRLYIEEGRCFVVTIYRIFEFIWKGMNEMKLHKMTLRKGFLFWEKKKSKGAWNCLG